MGPAVVGRVTREAGTTVVRVGGRLVEKVTSRCLVKHGRSSGDGGGTRATRVHDRRSWLIRLWLKRCVVMVTHGIDLTYTSNHGHPEHKLHQHHHQQVYTSWSSISLCEDLMHITLRKTTSSAFAEIPRGSCIIRLHHIPMVKTIVFANIIIILSHFLSFFPNEV